MTRVPVDKAYVMGLAIRTELLRVVAERHEFAHGFFLFLFLFDVVMKVAVRACLDRSELAGRSPDLYRVVMRGRLCFQNWHRVAGYRRRDDVPSHLLCERMPTARDCTDRRLRGMGELGRFDEATNPWVKDLRQAIKKPFFNYVDCICSAVNWRHRLTIFGRRTLNFGFNWKPMS